jgi:hypothetical protein
MLRISQAVASCRPSHLLKHCAARRSLGHGYCAGRDREHFKVFSMPVTKRVVAVTGFEDLGTEVWEIEAIDSGAEAHILIIPGNPGSAGILLHLDTWAFFWNGAV